MTIKADIRYLVRSLKVNLGVKEITGIGPRGVIFKVQWIVPDSQYTALKMPQSDGSIEDCILYSFNKPWRASLDKSTP